MRFPLHFQATCHLSDLSSSIWESVSIESRSNVGLRMQSSAWLRSSSCRLGCFQPACWCRGHVMQPISLCSSQPPREFEHQILSDAFPYGGNSTRQPCKWRPSVTPRQRLSKQKAESSSLAEGPASGSRTVKVAELLILLQVKTDVPDEAAEGLLDSLWSLQYMTGRGILCAFAGQCDPSWTRASAKEGLSTLRPTHAVHIRFTDLQAAHRFQEHKETVKVFDNKVKELCLSHQELLFEADVVMDMEQMFRRGPGFGEGVEHILTLQAEGNEGAEGDVYCSQLGQIAVSRLCNAVQSQVGRLIQISKQESLQDNVYIVMSRFEDELDAKRFASLPPVARILDGDGELPVELVLQSLLSIAAAQKSKSSTPAASRLH